MIFIKGTIQFGTSGCRLFQTGQSHLRSERREAFSQLGFRAWPPGIQSSLSSSQAANDLHAIERGYRDSQSAIRILTFAGKWGFGSVRKVARGSTQ